MKAVLALSVICHDWSVHPIDSRQLFVTGPQPIFQENHLRLSRLPCDNRLLPSLLFLFIYKESFYASSCLDRPGAAFVKDSKPTTLLASLSPGVGLDPFHWLGQLPLLTNAL